MEKQEKDSVYWTFQVDQNKKHSMSYELGRMVHILDSVFAARPIFYPNGSPFWFTGFALQ